MFLRSGSELPSVPPPRLFGEVRSAHPYDVEVARAQKRDVVGLGEKLRPVLHYFFQLLEGLPTFFDGGE